MEKTLFELVEAYDTITIFRHVSADSDALGSQFGLKQWIQDTYFDKKVFALGEDSGSKHFNYPAIDQASDEEVASSLAIILDTANCARIDDARWSTAKFKIKIDHHIFVETYADIEIIEDFAGATCEILARMFEEASCTISAACAQFLYGGLIADTLRFSIAATTPRMMRTAAFLIEAGVDVAKANEDNFSTSLKLYQYENYIRSHVSILHDKVAYIIINRDDYEAMDLTFNEAKEKVFVMGGVHEFQAWALFVEQKKDEQGNPIYNGSLRSKDKLINDIAANYNGGGHRYACGVKGLSKKDIEELLQTILNRVSN